MVHNQLRIPNSKFWGDFSEFEEESTMYANGLDQWTKDSQVEKYKLNIASLPRNVHKIIKVEILQSGNVEITDFNSLNPTPHVRKPVKRDSEYSPEWDEGGTAENAPVEVTFRQRFQNFNHKRC